MFGQEPVGQLHLDLRYTPTDKPRANLFFQLVSTRYEKDSVILASNKAFDEWGEVFVDDVIASAILDRPLSHSLIIAINGPSHRAKDDVKRNKVVKETPTC